MFKKIYKWWENLCDGCGLCCYEKEFNDEIIFINMNRPCEYLEVCSNRCTIYNKRLEINRDCKKVNLFEALFNPYLPGTCGYVKKVRLWKRRKGG